MLYIRRCRNHINTYYYSGELSLLRITRVLNGSNLKTRRTRQKSIFQTLPISKVIYRRYMRVYIYCFIFFMYRLSKRRSVLANTDVTGTRRIHFVRYGTTDVVYVRFKFEKYTNVTTTRG